MVFVSRLRLELHAVLLKQILAFGIVGVVGFLIDAGTLYALNAIGFGLFFGRIGSYVTAATTTWVLNRRYTFKQRSGHRLATEWLLFMLSQLSGATVNLGTYWWLVSNVPLVASQPVWGVAAGSLAGMIVNFFVARKFVFRARK